MESTTFASFQQPQNHNPHHPQGHISGGYPPNQNGNAPIASPNQQAMHPQPSQTSPLMTQGNPYGGHPAQNPQGHHQQISYNSGGYGVQGMPGYGMSASQAAAMASAAASGPHYYQMPGQGIPLQQDNKVDGRSRRSPPMQQQLPPGRRMSQAVGSPVVQHPQPGMSSGGRPAPMPQGGVQPGHQTSPEVVTGTAEEAPLYVNAKQFHRILKRRLARQKLEEQLRLTSKARKPYLHESRHNHAMRRPRGPGGRFLTSDEVAEMERKQKNNEDDTGAGGEIDDLDKGSTAGAGSSSVGKRKAAGSSNSSSKKAKSESSSMAVKHPDASAEEDEDEDDEEDGNDEA